MSVGSLIPAQTFDDVKCSQSVSSFLKRLCLLPASWPQVPSRRPAKPSLRTYTTHVAPGAVN